MVFCSAFSKTNQPTVSQSCAWVIEARARPHIASTARRGVKEVAWGPWPGLVPFGAHGVAKAQVAHTRPRQLREVGQPAHTSTPAGSTRQRGLGRTHHGAGYQTSTAASHSPQAARAPPPTTRHPPLYIGWRRTIASNHSARHAAPKGKRTHAHRCTLRAKSALPDLPTTARQAPICTRRHECARAPARPARPPPDGPPSQRLHDGPTALHPAPSPFLSIPHARAASRALRHPKAWAPHTPHHTSAPPRTTW